MDCSTPGLPVHPNSRSPPKSMSIESMMPSNHLILCCPLLLPSSIFPNVRVFSNESVLRIKWQSFGISASTSVLPVNIQDWFPFGWTGLILQFKGLSRVFSNTTVQKHQFFGAQLSLYYIVFLYKKNKVISLYFILNHTLQFIFLYKEI